MVVTGGQRNDGAMLAAVLADTYVPRLGAGGTDPTRSGGRRQGVLHRRNPHPARTTRMKAVIPPKSDHLTARARRGSVGRRPYAFDARAYRGGNVVERSSSRARQRPALATR